MVTKKTLESPDGYWLAETDARGRLKPGDGPGGHKASVVSFDGVASDPSVLELTSPVVEAAGT